VQPHGPYLLGGWCVGGIAALELARVLIEEGEQIQLMLLADTDRPSAARARAANLYFLRQRLRHIGQELSTILRADNRRKVHMIRELFRRKMGRADTGEIQEHAQFYRSKVRYRQMLYAHSARSYPGRLTLIVNEAQSRFDPDLGWQGFAAGGLEVRTSPGDHMTMFSVHHQVVAQTILKCICEATAAEQKDVRAGAVL
jgi:thioesterase domain-containing protein